MTTGTIDNQPISDQGELRRLAQALGDSPLIAIDTEFVRERTYYPKLCLIQVADDSTLAYVDCLAGLDLDPLYEVLFAPGRGWVLHSARQDIEVVWNSAHRLPERLIDTQIAAALLGYAPQIGLQDLLADILHVELDKNHARTDWTRRPIGQEAARYALDDVRYLLPVWRELSDRLESLNRLAWHEEDCRRQLEIPPTADAITVWQRLKALAAMTEAQRGAALALVQWREEKARKLDRPRRWILADESLNRIAKALPKDEAGLQAIEGLTRRMLANSGQELLDAIKKSNRSSIREAVASFRPTAKPDKAQLSALQELAKERAGSLGIEAEVLASRRDLTALALGEPPPHLARGWRADQLRR